MCNSRVIIKLQGGLGNQMFQYAAARGLVDEHTQIGLDYCFLNEHNRDTEHSTARKFELDIFKNLKAYSASLHLLSLFKSHKMTYKLYRALHIQKPRYVKQPDANYMSLPNLKRQQTYLDGYFQSAKYFQHIREQLLKEFQFPDLGHENYQVKQHITEFENSVSIHIRRGDYVRSSAINSVHGVLPLTYYQRATEVLKERYFELAYFVFSDDINWVKENLQLQNALYIDKNVGQNSWKDMALMAQCKHHIIANSSFSWWGAWLAQHNGITIAPAEWFNGQQVNFNITDYIPEQWVIISNDI